MCSQTERKYYFLWNLLKCIMNVNENSVNCPSQETKGTTRPVENVALTTKGLQERKHNL